jgi:hypothetical protein
MAEISQDNDFSGETLTVTIEKTPGDMNLSGSKCFLLSYVKKLSGSTKLTELIRPLKYF